MKIRKNCWLKPENVKKLERITKKWAKLTKNEKIAGKVTESIVLDRMIEVYPE